MNVHEKTAEKLPSHQFVIVGHVGLHRGNDEPMPSGPMKSGGITWSQGWAGVTKKETESEPSRPEITVT